jgi:hypothetical protein
MAGLKLLTILSVDEDLALLYLLVKVWNGIAILENTLAIFMKLKLQALWDVENPLLGVWQSKMETYAHQETAYGHS